MRRNKIQPVKIICQYHPPALGLVYKQPDNKTKLCKIDFNGMEQINDADKITHWIFTNHPLFFNEDDLILDQVRENVKKILENLGRRKSHSNSQLLQKKESPFTYDYNYDDEDNLL